MKRKKTEKEIELPKCHRCGSVNVLWKYVYLVCKDCGYDDTPKDGIYEMLLRDDDPFGIDGIEMAYSKPKPDYCINPSVESCALCSLVQYNLDCKNNDIW